ncbi:SDR family NAD(P)-dependent oxidoreductase [Pseudochryseolinea flava]|uniref:3-oxoacyl-ACP reductase n=1 Tax=Pseudochryseolinea flava TaxID=2059302 RepID=A0A364Y1H8_9BACT|nr:SDR family oxidoreductase [Pseudochryseolinea flava]RAW00564.1 3-oxoacyl-ACP reductase [Pseudochryseolinea flava]
MDLYLKGKTAIVTGASQGIGKAITLELSREGVQVFAVARNENLLAQLELQAVEQGGVKPVVFVKDFTAPEAPKEISIAAKSALGHVDILVNNAGRSRALDVVGSEEEWEAAMTLDFCRHRQLTQQLIPDFIARHQGAILNITSTYELRSINASAVAKASVVMWAKQLAGQLGQYGIRVNCLQPGLIETANIRRVFTKEDQKVFAAREIPLGEFGHPEDMANMAVFLVSDRARYITGSVSVVDGGWRHHAF